MSRHVVLRASIVVRHEVLEVQILVHFLKLIVEKMLRSS